METVLAIDSVFPRGINSWGKQPGVYTTRSSLRCFSFIRHARRFLFIRADKPVDGATKNLSLYRGDELLVPGSPQFSR